MRNDLSSPWFIGGVFDGYRSPHPAMMEDEAEQKQCVPVTEDARGNLKSAEVYQYFIRALDTVKNGVFHYSL